MSKWNKIRAITMLTKKVKSFDSTDIEWGTFTFDFYEESKFYRLPNSATHGSANRTSILKKISETVLKKNDFKLEIDIEAMKNEWAELEPELEDDEQSHIPAEPKLIVWTLTNIMDREKGAEKGHHEEGIDGERHSIKKLPGKSQKWRVFFRQLVKVIADTESWMIAQGNDTEFFRYIGDAIDDYALEVKHKPVGVIGLTVWPYYQTNVCDEMKINKRKIKKNDGSTEHYIEYQKPVKKRGKLSPHIKFHLFSDINYAQLLNTNHPNQSHIFECVICLNGDKETLKALIEKMERKMPIILIKDSGGITDAIIQYINTFTANQEATKAETFWKEYLNEDDQNTIQSSLKDSKLFVFELGDVFAPKDIGKAIVQAVDQKNWGDPNKNSRPYDFMNYLFLCVACNCFEENARDVLMKSLPYKKNPWLNLVLTSAIRHDQVKTVQFILRNSSIKLKKIYSLKRIEKLYNLKRPKYMRLLRINDILPKLIKLMGPIGYIKRLEGISHNSQSSNKENKDAPQDLFIWCILTNRLKLSILFWKYLDHPLIAALFAYGAFKRMGLKSVDRREKESLKTSMRTYSALAVEFVNKCYNSDDEQTFDLLRLRVPEWGNHSCIQVAMATNNKEFLYEAPCQALCNRLWWWGYQADSQDTRRIDYYDIADNQEVTIVQNGKIPKGVDRTTPKKKKRIIVSETWRQESCTQWIKYLLSPVVIFWFNTIGLVLFLLIYALLLTCKLEVGKIHWLEWVLWAWIVMFTLEEFRMFTTVISKTLTQRKYLNKNTTKFLALFAVLASTDSFRFIDVLSLICFYLAWSIRYLAYQGRMEEGSNMQAASIIFSIDYILYSLLIFRFFYANKFLGPMLVMIKKMLFTMLKFLVILFVIFSAFAVASESVLNPTTQLKPYFPYYVFRKAYWSLFGEFFLDEIEARESGEECTVDPLKYTDYSSLRCPTSLGRYYVPILMGAYVMITNILIFNLLIAKFNSTILKVESRAEIFWQLQGYELTDEYSRKIFLPPPFFMISILIIISRKWHENIFTKTFDKHILARLCRLERLAMDESDLPIKRKFPELFSEKLDKETETDASKQTDAVPSSDSNRGITDKEKSPVGPSSKLTISRAKTINIIKDVKGP